MALKFKRGQNGDTIVEVLIAIAVVSSVLAVAYATMNRNVRIIRDNQERTEASKLAQEQLEMLKQSWNTTSGKASIEANRDISTFCMYVSTDPVNPGILAAPNGTQAGTPNPNDDIQSSYNAFCRNSPIYYKFIDFDNGLYRIIVRWDKFGGGKSQIEMAYRLIE